LNFITDWSGMVLEKLNKFHFSFKNLLYSLSKKGGNNMVELYTALIINGRRTIDSVPSRYKVAVTELLGSLGLDENGNIA